MSIDLKTLENFSFSMAKCLSAGIPAKKALTLSSDKLKSKTLQHCIASAMPLIDKGHALSEALAVKSTLFPLFFIPLLRCGEESGKLVQAFEYSQDYSQKLRPTLDAVRKTWLYPVILITFGVLARSAIYLYFGAFQEAFFLLLWFISIAFGVYFFFKIPMIKGLVERIKLQIPLMRETEIDRSTSLFFKTFNLMYKAGNMGILAIFDLASSTIENSLIKKDFLRAREEIEKNNSLEKAFSQPIFLKQIYKDRIATGSLSGKLDECLEQIVKISTDELQYRLEIFNKFSLRIVAFNVTMSIVMVLLMFL